MRITEAYLTQNRDAWAKYIYLLQQKETTKIKKILMGVTLSA